eukprot:Clim_evm29s66 gene=Clim_evmTU29s66
MSTEAKPIDEAAFKAATQDVRNDASETTWVVAGHKDMDPNSLQIVASGTGGAEEIKEHLNETQIQYVLVRIKETVDMSETVKFVYVYFAGENVPFVKRGRLGVVKGSVDKYFEPNHVAYTITESSELTDEDLAKRVAEASMTADRILDKAEADKRPERVGGNKPSFQDSPHLAKSKETIGGDSQVKVNSSVRKSMGVEASDKVLAAIKDVRDDKSAINFLVAGYPDMDINKPLVVLGTGSEGLAGVRSELKEDIAAYALVRVTDAYERDAGAVSIDQAKFVYIRWVGERTAIMKKAKLSTHGGAAKDIFQPYHVNFDVTGLDEITNTIISDKVGAASGSKNFSK